MAFFTKLVLSDVLVDQIILWDVLWVNWTRYDVLAAHGALVDHLHEIHKVLLDFEAPHKLGIVLSPIQATTSGSYIVILERV